MPKRFTVKQHETVYQFIAARDGEYCIISDCHKRPLPNAPLQIDHADNNPDNWHPENLHLLCKKHNLAMRSVTKREHQKTISDCCALNERERARERGREGTNLVKDLVDYRNASPEMKANSYYEIQYREWVLTTIRENGFITKEEALNSGSEVVGCSQLSAGRYLAKLTSGVGALKQTKDATGTMIVSFKK